MGGQTKEYNVERGLRAGKSCLIRSLNVVSSWQLGVWGERETYKNGPRRPRRTTSYGKDKINHTRYLAATKHYFRLPRSRHKYGGKGCWSEEMKPSRDSASPPSKLFNNNPKDPNESVPHQQAWQDFVNGVTPCQTSRSYNPHPRKGLPKCQGKYSAHFLRQRGMSLPPPRFDGDRCGIHSARCQILQKDEARVISSDFLRISRIN